MSISVTLDGSQYAIPEKGDTDWNNDFTNWVVAANDAIASLNGATAATPWVSVKVHGAVGDGVTDDTTAIRAALTAVAANGTSGGTVYFPAGTYKITGTLQIGVSASQANVHLVGEGTSSIIKKSGAFGTTSAVEFRNATYCSVERLTIDGTSDSGTGDLLLFDGCTYCYVDACLIKNSKRYGINETQINGSGASRYNLYTSNFSSNATADINTSERTITSPAGIVNTGPLRQGGNYNSSNPAIIGTNYLWVDSNGSLRTKSSAPSTALDGAVVGNNYFVSVKEYGAVGDGSTDDYTAISNAITATAAGGTLFLPAGQYKITTPLVINKAINILGVGPQSAIWLNVGNANTGVTLGAAFPTGTTNLQNCVFRNFSIQGAANSCKYGLAVYQAFRCRFENVHLRPGATQHACLVGGALFSYFNFIATNNTTQGYYTNAGLWSGAGVLVQDLRNHPSYTSGSVMPSNINVFDCTVEAGTTTGGLCVEAQDQSGGNNVIKGTYEGLMNSGSSSVKGAGYSIRVEGAIGFTIKDCHLEDTLNGLYITSSSNFTISDSLQSPVTSLTGEKLTIISSSKFVIDRVVCGVLSIDASTCSDYEVSNCSGTTLPTGLYARYMHQRMTPFRDASSAIYGSASIGGHVGANLMLNSTLSRGTATQAADATYIGTNPTWTKCGDGLGDTTRRFHPYCYKVNASDNVHVPAFNVPDWANLVGQPVVVWMDIKNAGATDLYFGVYHQSGYHANVIIPSTETNWVRAAMTVIPQSGGTQLQIITKPTTNAAFTCYIGEVGAAVGMSCPSGFDSSEPSFSTGLQIAGRKIETGSAAPGSGTYQVGDIVLDTGVTAGGNIGWVCTTAGTPGTWKTWGVVAA